MTENRSNEDVADENKEHRNDEILSSEDVDESREHWINTKNERETRYIYVEATH